MIGVHYFSDFNSTKTDYTAFNDVMTSVAFSVYQAKEIELFAHDGEAMDYFHKELKNIEGWTTFSIFFKNNHIHYIMDNDLIRRYLIKPTFVGVKTKNETYFKIHSCKYNNNFSVIFMLYTYLVTNAFILFNIKFIMNVQN